MESVTVDNGPITLKVSVAGKGPLILCVHGWPELAYSWRHQLGHFAAHGYQVAALDVRGYGGSSKPREIADYTLRALASDVAAIIDQLGGGSAIVFGHDWGAPISWTTALLYPRKVSAVALLSVPYIPLGGMSFIDMMRSLYQDRFFYQLYFQGEGIAEGDDPFTDNNLIRIAKLQIGKILPFDLEQCDIGNHVGADQLRVILLPVGQRHRDLCSIAGNVVIGENESVRRNNKTRTESLHLL